MLVRTNRGMLLRAFGGSDGPKEPVIVRATSKDM